MKKYIFLFLVILNASYLLAEDPPTQLVSNTTLAYYKIGDVVSNFTLQAVDGNTYSFNTNLNIKGAIVIFTSMHCPFAKAYEDRQIILHNKYAALGYPVIAINPSNPQLHEDDALAKIQDRVKLKAYPFPYLIDPAQTVAKRFGPTRIPMAYIVQKIGNQWILKYFGMIDDNPQDENSVSHAYVEEAVNNLLEGKPVISPTTQAEGCRTRF